MHLRLNETKYVRVKGQIQRYEPGDWVRVGRHLGLQWLAEGSASIPGLENVEALAGDLETCAVLVRGSVALAKPIRSKYWGLSVQKWSGNLIKERNLVWNPRDIMLTPDQAIVGFARIEKTDGDYDDWDVAAMLLSEQAMAVHFGSKAEKQKTKKIIGDLRVPVYNTAAVWLRNSTRAKQLVTHWWTEIKSGADEYHAFLRAVYSTQPLICTLPAGWVGIR